MVVTGWGNIVIGGLLEIVGTVLFFNGEGIIGLLGLLLDGIGFFYILKGIQVQDPEERAATAAANAPADRSPRE